MKGESGLFMEKNQLVDFLDSHNPCCCKSVLLHIRFMENPEMQQIVHEHNDKISKVGKDPTMDY